MIVSHFAGARRPAAVRCEDLEWSTFVDLFRTPLPNDTPKMALSLWSPAKFTNDYRDSKNVEHVFALTFDVDKQPIPTGQELRNLQLKAVVSTSSSSTAAARRYRLVIALTRPVTGQEYGHIWSVISARLPFPVGKEARDPSRAWFVPRVGDDGTYDWFEVEGPPLDVDAVLAQPRPVASAQVPAPSALTGLRHTAAAAACLAAGWPAPGNRCAARLALRGVCFHESMPQDEAAAFVKLVHAQIPQRGEETDAKIEHDVADTYAVGARGEPAAGWKSLADAIGEQVSDAAHGLLDPFFAYGRARATGPAPASALSDAPGGFVGVSAAELARPLPPVSYIWQHFGVARGRPTLLSGYGGLGKTLIIQALVLHVAGARAHCWDLAIESGPVWHFDYEMTRQPLQRRYQRLAYGHGIDLPSCRLTLCSMPNIYLSDDRAEDELCRATEGVTLGVIDNLAAASATSTIGENEAGIRRYLDRLTRVTSRTNCAFIVLAHERKSGKDDDSSLQRVRGSSAITDACGSVISITTEADAGLLMLKQTKASSGRAGDDIALRLVDVLGDALSRGSPELSRGSPVALPPGLRVERVGYDEVAVAKRKKEQAAEQAAIDYMKRRLLETLAKYPEGISRTELQRLTRGTNAVKATALAEICRSGGIEQTGAFLYPKCLKL